MRYLPGNKVPQAPESANRPDILGRTLLRRSAFL